MMECFDLAKVFIRGLDLTTVFEEPMFGAVDRFMDWVMAGKGGCKFEGNIVEFFAMIRELKGPILEFFQCEGLGPTFYKTLLPKYMLGHAITKEMCDESCELRRILQLGANPDPKGFQITPLQIAVFSPDLAGVRTLLEADANPITRG